MVLADDLASRTSSSSCMWRIIKAATLWGDLLSILVKNGLGGRSCQSYEFFILHVEDYKSGNSLGRSPFDPAVETRWARNTERHRETPKAKGAIRAQ